MKEKGGGTKEQPLLQNVFLRLKLSANDKHMYVKLITALLMERNYSVREPSFFQETLFNREKKSPCIEHWVGYWQNSSRFSAFEVITQQNMKG